MYDVLWYTIEIHYTLGEITQIYFKSKSCLLILPNTTNEDPGISGVSKNWEDYGESKDIHCQVSHPPKLK